MIFCIPYAALLSIMVALVPAVGSSIAGIIVAAALTISLPLSRSTITFFLVYRVAEVYFVVPRIIGRAVKVPALVTVGAVLIGGALLVSSELWAPSPPLLLCRSSPENLVCPPG